MTHEQKRAWVQRRLWDAVGKNETMADLYAAWIVLDGAKQITVTGAWNYG